MVTHAKRDFGIFEVRQDLFADRSPAGDSVDAGGFLFQQRYDKSKRRESGKKEPLHRRHRNYGIPERSIAPSSLPKQELARGSSSTAVAFA
jgi:hypothetical protein